MKNNKQKEINLFRRIRTHNHFTQEEMANKIQVSISHYQKLEGDFVKPSFQVLMRFKKQFPYADMNDFFAK